MPPSHMLIRQGHIVLKKPKKAIESCTQAAIECETPVKCPMCDRFVDDAYRVTCLNTDCLLVCHLICLGQRFLEPDEYVPISGSCPKCRQMMLWSDVVRKFKGYSKTAVLMDDVDGDL